LNLAAARIDFLISSANKCIEGVSGFGLVLAWRTRLLDAKGQARTLSLDLHAQWAGLESDEQFRLTPPTHVLLAFHQALLELDAEGGPGDRAARYRANHPTLMRGMVEMGFETYLSAEDLSFIITTFRYPQDPRFCFDEFYQPSANRSS
jgi:2-aminoethylphosphonate-pyruvate transaminase